VEDSANPDATPFVVSAAGDVGIGTSSPAYRLDAQTTATGTAAGDNTVGFFGSLASGRDANIRFGDSVNASARIGYLSGALYMYTNAAERLRLDLSGNLGLGVTPSAWPGQSAGYYVSQFGNAAFYGLSTNEARMAANAFVDAIGTNRYISSGYATRHDQKDGVYIWRTAPSGTANSTTIVINNEYTIVTAGGNFTDFGAANNNVGTVFTANATGTASGGSSYADDCFHPSHDAVFRRNLPSKGSRNSRYNGRSYSSAGLPRRVP